MLSRLRVGELRGLAELEALAPAWSELAGRDPLATPFQRPEWLIPYCQAFGVTDPWAVAEARFSVSRTVQRYLDLYRALTNR